MCDLNTFLYTLSRVEVKSLKMKVTNGINFSGLNASRSSSTLNSLQLKIQASPSTSVSSLSELSPLSSEIVANSPSASSSPSTADLNDVILTGECFEYAKKKYKVLEACSELFSF